jgi:L-ascorbate metabolism protein UlaG (beta-lactamase superfamily)
MPIAIHQSADLLDVLRKGEEIGPAAACWLGQAGFLLRLGTVRLVIDAYLSDSLAVKYRGARFPHVRMLPPPIAPDDLAPVDAVLCTHAHTDHMDPQTLGPLARANPGCRFLVPRSAVATAIERGVPPERMDTANAGESGILPGPVRWHAIASAHERVETDSSGLHRYLGYILEIDGLRIYHSGDCVPYPGLADELRRHAVELAILPVNGRDAQRTAAGVLGNFTFDEAVDLCREAGIGSLLACHFGMFDFNTVDEAWLDDRVAATTSPPQCVRPRVGQAYHVAGTRRVPSACTAQCPAAAPRQSQETN